MTFMVFIILVGVALIDGKLWKMMAAQKDHNRQTEALLTEIRDRLPASTPKSSQAEGQPQ
jgi:large-conductance mechanosensitive channel